MKYSVSERAYEFLNLFKGKEAFVDIISKNGMKVYFNSKKLKIIKEESTIAIESTDGCRATVDLNIIEHYSCSLNPENQCEQTTLIDKYGNIIKVYLPIKENKEPDIATFKDTFGQEEEFIFLGDE